MALIAISLILITVCVVLLIGFVKSIYEDLDNDGY
jgi:uncharacterized membrane protein YqhA